MLFHNKEEQFDLPQAKLTYWAQLLEESEANILFDQILHNTNWRAEKVKVFGKLYDQPRLTALYSDTGLSYSYSGLTIHAEVFPEYIKQIKHRIESKCHHTFNTVLLNLYRDGSDSNGWHADNEKELGTNPIIASLSLGEERSFHFKHRQLKAERHKLALGNGSLLLMGGAMQHHWIHQIPKSKKPMGPRINLTFRTLRY